MVELKQFVGFTLSKEHYGIDIMAVEEIIRILEITPIPRAPAFVVGIINMRGMVIPVIDLRKKLAIPVNTNQSEKSRIIVSSCGGKRVGFIVDQVEEVLRINVDHIDQAPGSTRAIDNYISGVVRTPKGMVIILDVSKLFSQKERAELEKI